MKKHVMVTIDTTMEQEPLLEAVNQAVMDMQVRDKDANGLRPAVAMFPPLLTPAQTNFDDVEEFHQKFGVPVSLQPALLDPQTLNYRTKFLEEELDEFGDACREGDLAKAGDALIDLVYVAMGTASMMGLPWQDMWREVQTANMAKERSTGDDDERSVRKSMLDIVKPEGWRPPDHSGYVGWGPWPTFIASTNRIVHPGEVPEVTHFVGGAGE